MAEDLSQFVTTDKNGAIKVRPGVFALPPMATERAAGGQESTGGTDRSGSKRGGQGTSKEQSASRFAVLNAFVDGELRNRTRAEISVWLVLYRDARDGLAKRTLQSVRALRFVT
jgi:hypothetical protein